MSCGKKKTIQERQSLNELYVNNLISTVKHERDNSSQEEEKR